MNINPVSFGKVVQVKGSESMAHNIASLANSDVENKSQKSVQQDAKMFFDDITENGPVKVYSYRDGKSVYLVSGEDAEATQWYQNFGDADVQSALDKMPPGKERERFVRDVKTETQDNIKRYIISHMEPYAISVRELKGEPHLHIVNRNA